MLFKNDIIIFCIRVSKTIKIEQTERNIHMENTEYLASDRLRISPRAYALALQNNVDILKIVPSGPEGRIIENDILRAIEERNKPMEKEPVAEETNVPVTEDPVSDVSESVETIENSAEKAADVTENASEDLQNDEKIEENSEKTEENAEENSGNDAPAEAEAPIEEAMETAIVTAPVTAVTAEEKDEPKKEEPSEKPFRSEDAYRHTDVIIPQNDEAPDASPITIEMSFDATALVTLRGKIKEHGETMGLPCVTLNDMILFAVAKTLKKHKAMNAHFLEDKIRYFDGIHLGFAIDTDRGPQTLTVFDADRLSLSSLSKITGALIRGIRAGGETPEKNLRMGSFTVTNVGTLGVERFTPRLTAPQTGILGVSALTKRIKTENGEDVSYPCIPLALTFDPRAMSTANAAKFLRDLCLALEHFGLILIK